MILFLFAFISGLVTIAAPCIWPLLPIVLSSSANGDKRKALGISLGISLSFAFFTLSISYIVRILPISADLFRLLAVVVIAFLGLALIVPSISQVVEGEVSKLSGKFGVKKRGGTSLLSGFITGLSLGIVWSPCAGPILATIAALASTRAVNSEVVFVTLSYSLGAGIPLFLFSLLGSSLFKRTGVLGKYTGTLQKVFGVIMILTSLLILTNQDKILQVALLNAVPSYSDFINKFESNPAVTDRLSNLKGGQLSLAGTPLNPIDQARGESGLPDLGQAPDFIGVTNWINSKPLTINDLKGKVVLVDFWTYTCINCIRTLPFVTSWYDKYKDQGFVVIGVHTPEFEFEKETPNVINAIRQYNIHYPVAQDNDYKTWANFSNEYWPAEYLIDVNGRVRRTHFGEGEYDQTEKAIQALLKEKGESVNQGLTNMADQTPKSQLSPESYLGFERMEFLYPQGKVGVGAQNFNLQTSIPLNSFSYGGSWQIMDSYAVSGDSSVIEYHFYADKVYLVARPGQGNKSAQVKITVDGKALDNTNQGDDIRNGILTIDSDRLYNLINLKGKVEDHILRLEFLTPKTEPFVFTFG